MYKKLVDEEGLRDILRRECEKAGSQSKWAEQANVTPQYVSDVLAGRRMPGASVAEALGYAKRPDVWEHRTEDDDK